LQTTVIWSPNLQGFVRDLKKLSANLIENVNIGPQLSLSSSERNAASRLFAEERTLTSTAIYWAS